MAGLKFNAFIGLFTAIIFFVISGFKIQFSFFSLLVAFIMSSCAMLYSVLGFKILKNGNVSAYSIFLMSGGMLLPYIVGVALWDEKISVFRITGVIVISAAGLRSSLK